MSYQHFGIYGLAPEDELLALSIEEVVGMHGRWEGHMLVLDHYTMTYTVLRVILMTTDDLQQIIQIDESSTIGYFSYRAPAMGRYEDEVRGRLHE